MTVLATVIGLVTLAPLRFGARPGTRKPAGQRGGRPVPFPGRGADDLVAGTEEPFFLANATRWADALREAGGDVVMAERAGSHGDALWKQEIPLMVAWAFGH